MSESFWTTRRSRLRTETRKIHPAISVKWCHYHIFVRKMQILPVVFMLDIFQWLNISIVLRLQRCQIHHFSAEHPDLTASDDACPKRTSFRAKKRHKRKFISADNIRGRVLSVTAQKLTAASQTWKADRVMGWKLEASGATPRRHKSDTITHHKAFRIPLQAQGFSRNSLKSFSARYPQGGGRGGGQSFTFFLEIEAWKQEIHWGPLTVNKDLFIYLRNFSAHARIQLS